LPTPPAYLAGLPVIDPADRDEDASILAAMAAESPEELLADPDSGGLRDLSGQVIVITSVVGITPSTIRDGDYFIVFEAMTGEDGKIVTLTTGSKYAVPRIAVLAAKGWLPRAVRVTQLASASNPGQSSLWITDVAQTEKPALGKAY
jgi:hypothetical protein